MRTALVIVPLVVFAVATGTASTQKRDAPPPPPWCLSTTDSNARAMLRILQKFGSSTDSDWAVRRAAIGVPLTPVEAIRMLNDESLCERASKGVDSDLVSGPPLHQAVYLARFGEFYAAFPPGLDAGEWGLIGFFDSTFVFKKALAW